MNAKTVVGIEDTDSGYWALMPNSQKGYRYGARDIWHFMKPYHQLEGGFNRGYSCYKKEGQYYSSCRAGISDNFAKAKQTERPPSKDSCPICVKLYNRVTK